MSILRTVTTAALLFFLQSTPAHAPTHAWEWDAENFKQEAVSGLSILIGVQGR